jgi:hypothetical protein
LPGVVGLLGVIALNWLRYKRGLPTICATFRRYVPRWAVVPFWSAISAYMIPHLRRGYPRRSKETP